MVSKKRPYLMLGSSYTVAADPNTMRDQGELRNAQYRIAADEADKEYARRSTMVFKGKESLEEERRIRLSLDAICPHRRPESQLNRKSMMNQSNSFAFASGLRNSREVRVIEQPVLVAVADYTKNISEYLFSPGLKKRSETAAKAPRSKTSRPFYQMSTSSTKKSSGSRRAKEIEKEIEEAREKRSQISKDVEIIKQKTGNL
jgi:hypothetical protein